MSFWSTSWSGTLHFILHTFLHPIILLSVFAAHAHTIVTCFALVPRFCYFILVSFSTLLETLSFTIMSHNTHPSDHSHLCPLKCHLIFFSYRPGLTYALQHTTSLHSLPLIINDISLLVVVGCWHGYLSEVRCRFAYGPADATTTHYLLLQ